MKTFKYMSRRLFGNPFVSEYNETLKKLQEISEKINPDGELQVSLLDKGEVYSMNNKVIKDIKNLEKTYSHQELQRKPEIAGEFQIIADAIGTIRKTVAKRLREQQDRRAAFTKKRKSKEEN